MYTICIILPYYNNKLIFLDSFSTISESVDMIKVTNLGYCYIKNVDPTLLSPLEPVDLDWENINIFLLKEHDNCDTRHKKRLKIYDDFLYSRCIDNIFLPFVSNIDINRIEILHVDKIQFNINSNILYFSEINIYYDEIEYIKVLNMSNIKKKLLCDTIKFRYYNIFFEILNNIIKRFTNSR